MIVQLILLACVGTLDASDDVQKLTNSIANALKAYEILRDNILTMDGNIPLLNDSRRHYAEIIHVIHYEALQDIKFSSHDYFKDYQKNVNKSAQFALVSPQAVVDITKQVITDIVMSAKVFDNDQSWKIFDAASLVATQLNQYHKDYFAPHSQNLTAHNFVITGAAKLKKIVTSLKNLYMFMYLK